MTINDDAIADILNYWFGDIGDGFELGAQSQLWFQGDADTDRDIRERFGDWVTRALAGELSAWCERADACLALVLLLDQFTRNIYRGQARAFAGDTLARDVVVDALQRGFDRQLPFIQRTFFYMPLMHSEQLADQRRCVALFEALLNEVPEAGRAIIANNLRFAEQHRDLIEQFGRFPYRNDVLGREPTVAERDYLEQGGARFGQ